MSISDDFDMDFNGYLYLIYKVADVDLKASHRLVYILYNSSTVGSFHVDGRLSYAFEWGSTDEGAGYWGDIDNKLDHRRHFSIDTVIDLFVEQSIKACVRYDLYIDNADNTDNTVRQWVFDTTEGERLGPYKGSFKDAVIQAMIESDRMDDRLVLNSV